VPEQDYVMGKVGNKVVRCDILIATYEHCGLLTCDVTWPGGWLTHFGKTHNLQLHDKTRWRKQIPLKDIPDYMASHSRRV
jgi:hypothetical protein